jgi:hypothetical protein
MNGVRRIRSPLQSRSLGRRESWSVGIGPDPSSCSFGRVFSIPRHMTYATCAEQTMLAVARAVNLGR